MEWHLAVASGHDPRLETDEETGELHVVIANRGGYMPDLSQKTASMEWLANRAYGQAPQMLHLEGHLKIGADQHDGPSFGQHSIAALRAIREAARLASLPAEGTRFLIPMPTSPTSPTSVQHAAIDAINVECVELVVIEPELTSEPPAE